MNLEGSFSLPVEGAFTYQNFMDKIPNGLGIFSYEDHKFTTIYLNEAYYQMLHTRRQQRASQVPDPLLAVRKEDRAGLLQEIEAAIREDRPIDCNLRLLLGEGNYRWFKLRAMVVERQGARFIWYASYTDVDSLIKAEQTMNESRMRYALAVRGARLIIWEYDVVTKIMCIPEGESNDLAREQYGFEDNVIENVPESVLPMVLTEADRQKFTALFARIRDGEEHLEDEVWFRHPLTGKPYCEHINCYVVKDGEGRPVRAYGIGNNVTAQKQEQLSFHQALQAILTANPDALCTFHINLTENRCFEGNGVSTYVLKTLQAQTVDGLFANALTIISCPADRKSFQALFKRPKLLTEFASGRSNLHLDYRRADEAGHPFWVRTYVSLLQNPDTQAVEGVIYSLDISREMRRREIFKIITGEEYDLIALYHLDTNMVEAIQVSSQLPKVYGLSLTEAGDTCEAQTMHKNSVETWVVPEERERYLKETSREHLCSQLDQNGRHEVTVHGFLPGKGEVYRKLQHYYLNQQKDAILVIEADVTQAYLKQKQKLAEQQKQQLARIQLEEQYNNAQAFLSSVGDSYLVARRINLTQNRVEHSSGVDPLPQVLSHENYEDSIQALLKEIPGTEEKRQGADFYNRRKLLAAYEKGTRKLELEHQCLRSDGNVLWVHSAINLSQRPGSGDVIAFLAVSNIDRAKLTGLVMDQLINRQFDNICCIDAKRDLIKLYLNGGNDPEDNYLINGLSYEKTMRDYNNRLVVPEERERCVSFMTLRNVLYQLETKGRCQDFFQLQVRGQLLVKQLEFFYVDRENKLVAFLRTDCTETRKKQLEQEEKLRAALASAQTASAAKSDFLSRMSHDMRTPLNGIIGMTYLAREIKNSPQTVDYLNKIDTSSKFLLGLINDILDMTKVESRKVELHQEPYWPQEFYNYMEAVIRPLCQDKHQTLTLKANPPSEAVPMFDKLRINQVLFNLLSNAVKYTPEGGKIVYEGFFGPVVEERAQVEIKVCDNGIGMSEAFQKKLFEPFSREERPDALKAQGTGLGLAIAKRMVELMGGTITVQSKIHEGTTFTIKLTVNCVPKSKLTAREVVPAAGGVSGNLAGRHILLCEDHPLNQELARKLLEKKQALVELAENGQQGVDFFSRSPEYFYDLVLMDIRMPVMNGYEAAKAIRNLKRADARLVPIIAMTADAFDEDVHKSLEAGMNGHIAKPVDPPRMYKTLAEVLSKKPE